jgi:hypothetical protein
VRSQHEAKQLALTKCAAECDKLRELSAQVWEITRSRLHLAARRGRHF